MSVKMPVTSAPTSISVENIGTSPAPTLAFRSSI